MRWLFQGKEVRIEARCLDCGEPMMVRVKDDELLETSPETLVGHITFPMRQWREMSNAYL